MIAARQIAFGRGSKHKPYDAEIEYLESTGTQYIDTGVMGLNSVRMEGVFSVPVYYENMTVTGCAGDTQTTVQRIVVANINSVRRIILQRGAFGPGRISIPWDENWHSFSFDAGSATIDNMSSKGAFDIVDVPNKSIVIFAGRPIAKDYVIYGICRFASYRIYVSDALVLDLIPVRKGNVGYMYDRVSGQLFGNQGTGEFVLGDDL